MFPDTLLRTTLKIFLVVFFFGVVFTGYYTLKAWQYYRTHLSPFTGDSFIQEDPLLGFVQRPNITTHVESPVPYTIYTDDGGFRVDRPGLQAPPTVDLLSVGCSFTWGHGVEDSQTYIKILAREKKMVVANAAMASYGTPTAYLSMLRHAHLQPRVILYGFIADQIPRSFTPCASTISPYCRAVPFVDFTSQGTPFLHPPYRSEDYYRYMQDILMRHDFGFKDVQWAWKRDYLRLMRRDKTRMNQRYRFYENSERRMKAMDYLLGQMIQTAQKMQALFILLYIPQNLLDSPPVELIEAVSKQKGKKGFFFVDLTSALRSYASNSLWLNASDQHPNPTMHALMASELGRFWESEPFRRAVSFARSEAKSARKHGGSADLFGGKSLI